MEKQAFPEICPNIRARCGRGVELKAWQVFLEALFATATSLSNTANLGLGAEEGVQLMVWQVFLEGLSATVTSLSNTTNSVLMD